MRELAIQLIVPFVGGLIACVIGNFIYNLMQYIIVPKDWDL